MTTKSTATDEIIKRYKTAKNPAVEQAATEVLSHKYSNQKRPTNRLILAKIKGCKPEEVLNEEIKQVNDLVTNRQKRIEAQGVPSRGGGGGGRRGRCRSSLERRVHYLLSYQLWLWIFAVMEFSLIFLAAGFEFRRMTILLLLTKQHPVS